MSQNVKIELIGCVKMPKNHSLGAIELMNITNSDI